MRRRIPRTAAKSNRKFQLNCLIVQTIGKLNDLTIVQCPPTVCSLKLNQINCI